jgi:anti-sigma B factor antagonist
MNGQEHQMRVETTRVGETPVVKVRGEVDLRNSPTLRELLMDVVERSSGKLVIDLSRVPHMDSSGVGTLVFVKRQVERAGRQVVLVGVQRRVRSVFEITNLDKFFTLADDMQEAMEL